jgi:hypothetical protein
MKTALPAREDYYRSARACELREQAARLERQCACLPWMMLFGIAMVWGLPLLLFQCRSFRRIGHHRQEADRLEAEHRSHHGAASSRGVT